MRICSSGIRFFSHHVLERDWKTLDLMRAASEHRLPALLSLEEVTVFSMPPPPCTLVSPSPPSTAVGFACTSALPPGRAIAMARATWSMSTAARAPKTAMSPCLDDTLDSSALSWKTHRHPTWLFPATGRDHTHMATATSPMSRSSVQVASAKPTSGPASSNADVHFHRCGTSLHTAHPSSIAEIRSPHHPFFGQTVEILRWLRRQTSESVVSKLPEGLPIAIPAWRLDPLACQHVSEAPKPRLSVDARVALRDRLEQPPLLPATSLAIPGASHLQGDRDAHQSSLSPPHPAPATLRPPHRVAAAPRSPASPMSRVAHPAARPGDTRRVEPGASPGAPR